MLRTSSVFFFALALVFACSSDPGAADGGDSGTESDASVNDAAIDASQPSDGSTDVATPDVITSTDAGLAVVRSFEGDFDIAGSLCNGECDYRNHPDMSIAANGTQVVEATGQFITVFDYSGKILKQTSLTNFIQNANLTVGKLNDPRMTYDPFISKWIVACSCSNDFLMVSKTSDATGGWTGYTLGVNSGDLTMWPGWDKFGVYVSEFNDPNPPYPYAVIALDNTFANKSVFTNFPYETRPAMDPDPNKKVGAPEYFVARSGPVQNGVNVAFNVLVDSVSWNGTTATQGTQKSIASGYLYNTPVDAAQPNGPPLKSLESHRAFASVVQNGHFHTVISSGPCTSNCGTQGVDANQLFFWFDVDLGTMTLAQSAKVSSPTDAYLFPSLATDALGNVGMVATSVSATKDASVVLFGHLVTDAKGFVSAPLVAAAGTSTFTCISATPVGWGTYTNAYQNPSDPTKLWAVEEYAASATDCQWHTRVLQFTP